MHKLVLVLLFTIAIYANDVLEVGYTQVDITPEVATWIDSDGDGKYTFGDGSAYDAGEKITSFVDGKINIGNGNGEAHYIHDRIYARIMVINDPSTKKKVAFVSLDLYMMQLQDCDFIRNLVSDLSFEHIAIHSTHSHMGPDTLGRSGAKNLENGINGAWFRKMQKATAKGLRDAFANRTPAKLRFLGTKTRFGLNDTRDPIIYDDDLMGMQAVKTNGEVLVTLVQWANHVEAILSFHKGNGAPDNAKEKTGHIITPGFPAFVDTQAQKMFGGHGIFINGAVGGLMTMLRTFVWEPFAPYSPDTPVEKIPKDFTGKIHDNFKMAEIIGCELVNKLHREKLVDQPFAENLFVSAKTEKIKVKLDNDLFRMAFLAGFIGFDKREFEGDIAGEAFLKTQVSRIDIGPAQFACVPGEIFPELTIGLPKDFYSKNGKYFKEPQHHKTGGDFKVAKSVKSMMTAKYKFIIGLSDDSIGYMVAPCDFLLDENYPWIESAPDHYEETQSVGIQAVPKVMEGLSKLFSEK
ncbi:hypothetical protein [Candidatus Uabimicrobium sp. HlEnr_7]|uniref:hypothetical protein n=1 Tax=Candidatus Uabimicrobium helgolandensis TaxID=3095367 RepID=UPI003558FF6A